MAAASGLLVAQAASAALVIDVGTHNLVGNSPTTQFIDLFLLNTGADERTGGVDLYVQIGDGLGSTPSIVSVDLISGTIFEGNSIGGGSDYSSPQSVYQGVLKAFGSPGSGPVYPGSSTSSKVARVGISTLGYSSGTLAFNILDTLNGSSLFYKDDENGDPLAIEISDGFLNISPVPEPSQIGWTVGLGLAAFGVWRRTHRG